MNIIDWKATLDIEENEELNLKDCVETLAGAINILVDEHNAVVTEVAKLEGLLSKLMEKLNPPKEEPAKKERKPRKKAEKPEPEETKE